MFERCTEAARRAIFFARYKASFFTSRSDCQSVSRHIETEHLLLGLLREDKALARQILGSRVSVRTVEMEIGEHIVNRERVSLTIDMPLSDEAKRALAFAALEAQERGRGRIETHDLLVGLIRVRDSLAAQILQARGVKLNDIRAGFARRQHQIGFKTMIARFLSTSARS